MNLQAEIKKASALNKTAMLNIYNTYKKKVWSLCSLLVTDELKSKKAFLQSFEKLWMNIENKSKLTVSDFETLLFSGVVKSCQKQVEFSNDAIANDSNIELSKKDSIIAPDKLTSEQKKLLLKSILKLNDGHRFCIVLSSCLGYSAKNISDAMGITLDKVNNNLKYGRENLKKCFKTEFKSISKKDIIFLLTATDIVLKETLNSNVVSSEIDKEEKVVIDKYGKKSGFNFKVLIPVIVIVAVLIVGGAVWGFTSLFANNTSKDGNLTGTHHAVIDIKDYGKINLELDADSAPITVTNFVNLAKDKFYNGLKFHRIMKDFMMQGGDPKGDGTGGSDKNIKGEFTENGVDNPLKNSRGTIAMARSLDNDSASSQFFINQRDNTSLDGKYAVFGKVTDGLDIVDKICDNVSNTDSNGSVKEEDKPIINSITITD